MPAVAMTRPLWTDSVSYVKGKRNEGNEDARSERLGQLDSRQSNARSSRMNQHLCSLFHLRDDEQGLPRRQPVLGNGSGLLPRDVVWLASAHAGWDGDVLGVGAAGCEAEAARRGSAGGGGER